MPIRDGEPLLEALEDFRLLKVVVEPKPIWPRIHGLLESTEIGSPRAHVSALQSITSGNRTNTTAAERQPALWLRDA